MQATMVINRRTTVLLSWRFALLICLIQASDSEDAFLRDTPEVYNVRCDVRDLETTIKWNVTETNTDLRLIRYVIRFCPPSVCDVKQRLLCFKDDARTKELHKVKETSCKAGISQLLTWDSYVFRVTAQYRNLTSDSLEKISNWTVCKPIARKTSLSAPSITTSSTKNSITITLNLDKNLQRTLAKTKDEGDLSMSDVTYYYFLAPKGQRFRRSESSRIRKSLNYYETYENIAPNEEYDIHGWYTIRKLKNEESEIASTKEKTKPDPFPQWAQIVFICGLSFLVILTIISTITYKECRKREKMVKEAKFKPTLNFEQCLKDIHDSDPWLMEETFEDDESVILAPLLIKRDILLGDDADNNELTTSFHHETVKLPATEEVPQYTFVNGGNSVSSDDDYIPQEYSLKL